jgi:hypothetical protein
MRNAMKQAEGAVEELTGKAKSAAGKLTNNKSMQVSGKARPNYPRGLALRRREPVMAAAEQAAGSGAPAAARRLQRVAPKHAAAQAARVPHRHPQLRPRTTTP